MICKELASAKATETCPGSSRAHQPREEAALTGATPARAVPCRAGLRAELGEGVMREQDLEGSWVGEAGGCVKMLESLSL